MEDAIEPASKASISKKMDENVNEEGSSSAEAAAAASHQQPNKEQGQGTADQVQALLQSLDLITRLAAMDTETYSQTLHHAPSTSTNTTDDDDLRNAAVLQQRLDEMQRQWKLEDTAVPRLLDSIHRLQSTCLQLASQNDLITQENSAMRNDQSSSEHRVHTLEAAVQKLHKKNERLKEKLLSKRSENQSLLKNVRSYVRDFHKQELQLDDQRLATQLEAHERVMGNRSRTSSHDYHPRSRTSSRDTTFSDVDVAAIYQLPNNNNILGNGNYYYSDGDEDDFPDTGSYRSSISSVASSVITDDGVATLQIAAVEQEDEMVLHYPIDGKLGLQFHRMTLPAKQGVLDGQRLADDSKESATGNKSSTTAASFSSQLHFKFLGGSSTTKKEEESVLIVCGHNGFDQSIHHNRRPPPVVGARLTSVNDTPLEDGATLAQIRTAIEGYPFTMSFRVIPLTAKQKEVVDKASKVAQTKYESLLSDGDANNDDYDYTEIVSAETVETGDVLLSEAHSEKLRKQMKSVSKNVGKNMGSMGKNMGTMGKN
eukprot:CAMPEP_0119028640 /NCGR_PEP_ID=MMETSP1176-20130426/39239_1 /TAXON_ID=265551 /ORGANISM="Synedropsis recta cf, Strain CCMP1620" /LENGTH=540 /DNA_ID=CAMNT_0006984819 /DNA_START=91 /DNA_END=1710 /DNA_ORIENTATION=-